MTIEERLSLLEQQIAAQVPTPTEYYTSRWSGEEIDKGIGGALQLGGATTPQAALRNIGGRPNRNLLDNWYFVGGGSQQGGGQFPINQRGQTSYTGVGYWIDRWILDGENASMLIEGSGLHFVSSASATGNEAIHQRFENPGRYSGKAVTYSMLGSTSHSFGMLLLVNGSIFGPVNSGVVAGETLLSYTAVLPDNITSLEAYYYPKSASGTGEAYLRGCKLELGTQQTLAYQDEDGNWQLFETPDYGEELAKCQRYYLPVDNYGRFAGCFGETANNLQVFVPTPVTMRTNPSVQGITSLSARVYSGAANSASLSVSQTLITAGGVLINFSVTFASSNPNIYSTATVVFGQAGALSAEL